MDYKKLYKEALERAEKVHKETESAVTAYAIEEIFHELKESEDERVRKELIDFLKEEEAKADITSNRSKILCKYIVWLEKQVQKPTKFKIGDLVVKKDGDIFHNGSKFAQITKIEIEKDPERYWFDCGSWLNAEDIKLWKPTWSEEDETHLDSIIENYKFLIDYYRACCEKDFLSQERQNEDIYFLKSLKDRVQPNKEWSEEDEKKIMWFVRLISTAGYRELETDKMPCSRRELLDWLKSLKPQPKYQWTDEDEKNLKDLLAYGETKLGLRRWIAGLPEKLGSRSEYHWKPTEEQMEALSIAVHDAHEHRYYKNLYSLYNDLKSL